MLPITNKFTNCTISNRYGTKIQWIVMHYFGGLSTAMECAGWFCNPSNNQGSADFCVDDDYIIQVNPDLVKYNTWHCGGGLQGSIRHSKYGICKNSNSIGIEMRPYNDRGAVSAAQNAGWYFHQKTVDNAVDLVKYLMKKYNIDADHVIMHADVTGKYCPAPWLDHLEQWDSFQKAIRGASSVTPPAGGQATEMYRVRKTWADAASQIGAFTVLDNAKRMADQNPQYKVYNSKGSVVYSPSGETTDSTDINVDGSWGSKTTRKLQKIFGTTQDGVISNQWAMYESQNPGLYDGWEWFSRPNGQGSELIKAMQMWAGMSVSDQDGEIGPNTIKAIQRKLGTTQDGYFSYPSDCIKALQKWANSKD